MSYLREYYKGWPYNGLYYQKLNEIYHLLYNYLMNKIIAINNSKINKRNSQIKKYDINKILNFIDKIYLKEYYF